MLMDGGVLDELIQQKLDAFHARWDELMARVRRAEKANTLLFRFMSGADIKKAGIRTAKDLFAESDLATYAAMQAASF